MKKFITFLIALGAFVSVQAQTSREEARRVILGQPKNTDNGSRNDRDVILGGNSRTDYPTYPGGSSTQVDQINRDYDNKIQSVRNNPYLSQAEKDRMIQQLERDRQRRIREINNSNNGGRYNDDDRYDNKKYKKHKSNNGKHKGWTKGKGNKHRDRDDD